MKRRSNLTWLVLILILGLIAGYLVAISKAKTHISNVIEERLNRQASIGSVTVGLPLNLQIDNLRLFEKTNDTKAQEFFYAERLSIMPSILPLFARRLVIRELRVDHPRIIVVKGEDGKYNFLDFFEKESNVAQKDVKYKKGGGGFLILSALNISNGSIKYIDRQIAREGEGILMDSVNINIDRLIFPLTPMRTNFGASAEIPYRQGSAKGRVRLNGWIDINKKDMDAKLQLDGLEIQHLKPYLKAHRTANIESGTIYFNSDIVAKNNDLIAECKLNIKDIDFTSEPDGLKLFGIPISALTDIIKDERKELALDFTIKTELDKPRLKIVKISGNLVSTGLKSAIVTGIEKALEKVGEGGNIIEEAGNKLKELIQTE